MFAIATDRCDNILIGTCHMHIRLNEATTFEAYERQAVCHSKMEFWVSAAAATCNPAKC